MAAVTMTMRWGKVYLAALRRGFDHGYAAYRADVAEARAAKKVRMCDGGCGRPAVSGQHDDIALCTNCAAEIELVRGETT